MKTIKKHSFGWPWILKCMN